MNIEPNSIDPGTEEGTGGEYGPVYEDPFGAPAGSMGIGDGGGYWPAEGEVTPIDVNGDGLIDAIEVVTSGGDVIYVLDSDDSDRLTDSARFHGSNGERIIITLMPDDGYQVLVDADGDGTFEMNMMVSHAEFAAAYPQIAAALGVDIDALTAAISGATGPRPQPPDIFVPQSGYVEGGFWAGQPQYDLFGQDGVADAVQVTFTWNNQQYLGWAVDQNADSVADYIVIDTNGDGYAESIFTPDGQGGWQYTHVATTESVNPLVPPDSFEINTQPSIEHSQPSEGVDGIIYKPGYPPISPPVDNPRGGTSAMLTASIEQSRIVATKALMTYWEAWYEPMYGPFPADANGYALEPRPALKHMYTNGSHLTDAQVQSLAEVQDHLKHIMDNVISSF